ncbi:MAG: CoA transferase [Chloroflexi bacterium]|nr:CoA transferase [Chloroflexota bacterium]
MITDLQPVEAESLGLDHLSLAGPGGEAVVVSVTPFGMDGPDADRPVAGSLLEGVRADVVAVLAGAHAAVAALAAVRWARYHHQSVGVEVSALEVIAACLGGHLPRAACPRSPARNGAGAQSDRRPAVLPCADGYVGVDAPTTADRVYLAAMTGVDAVRDETADLGEMLGPWLRDQTRSQVFHTAQLWRLPFVPVLDPEEVRCDDQSVARSVWTSDPDRGAIARPPFRFTQGAGADQPPARPESLPLSDVRALDLGMVWAGPYCGRLLAGLGAEVVKVEGPSRPDGTRPADPEADGCSGVFGDLNRGKASLVLDLTRKAGRDLFVRVAADADVVVENFSPRVMPNFGLGYDVLAAVNSALIMLSMPAFGADGPWAAYVAYGSGLELMTGLAGLGPSGRPEPAPVAYLDYLAGAYGAAGVLAALLARDGGGGGAHVETAQREVACQLLESRPSHGARRQALVVDPAALAADPHLAARGLFFRASSTARECHHYARLPWRLHGIAEREERAAPAFGADSRRVLRRLARLSPAEVEDLVRAGVVAG